MYFLFATFFACSLLCISCSDWKSQDNEGSNSESDNSPSTLAQPEKARENTAPQKSTIETYAQEKSPFDYVYRKSTGKAFYKGIALGGGKYEVPQFSVDDREVTEVFGPDANKMMVVNSAKEAKELVEAGLDLYKQDKNGDSFLVMAIYYAFDKDQLDKLHYLLTFATDIPFSEKKVSAQILERFFAQLGDSLYCIDMTSGDQNKKAKSLANFTFVFSQLMQIGVDPDVVLSGNNIFGPIVYKTPLQIAKERKYQKIAEIIESKL